VTDKLVRDRIPERFPTDTFRFADTSEMFDLLLDKLGEETAEFRSDRTLEELADVLEVVVTLAGAMGFSPAELERTRLRKRELAGAFDRRTVWVRPEEIER
jgi:predicted house-cleaning noncanonical NTP pyrophosphatase (MazG superfamily)